jgi:hypothetical protein
LNSRNLRIIQELDLDTDNLYVFSMKVNYWGMERFITMPKHTSSNDVGLLGDGKLGIPLRLSCANDRGTSRVEGSENRSSLRFSEHKC